MFKIPDTTFLFHAETRWCDPLVLLKSGVSSTKVLLRDQSIFMGIRDREICNGTTHYFGFLVERGHRLFWGLALRGHGLFQYRISTGPKIIFKYSGAGSWTISSFFWSFSYKKYGTRANLYYGTNIYFGWRFQRGRGKFLTKRVRGHALFCMVKSTGPREISPLVTAHFPVPYSHKYWPVP